MFFWKTDTNPLPHPIHESRGGVLTLTDPHPAAKKGIMIREGGGGCRESLVGHPKMHMICINFMDAGLCLGWGVWM